MRFIPSITAGAIYSSVRRSGTGLARSCSPSAPTRKAFLIVRRFAERPKEGSPAFFTSALPDYHLLRPNVVAIPLRLRTSPAEVSPSTPSRARCTSISGHNGTTANLSQGARQYLASLTSASPDEDEALSRSVWYHALAILYTPLYLSEHVSAVRADWPRIPLPTTLAALQQSAQLGITVGQLLDMDSAALGVTTGKLRKELNFLGRVSGPQKGLSLAITAGWGHGQKEKDIVMPGRGIEKRREFTAEEENAIAEGAKDLGLAPEEVTALWGSHTLDIYLNNETLLEQRAGGRLGICDWRIPGAEEMAQLPRAPSARPRHHERRSQGVHAYRAPHRRASAAGAGAGQELLRDQNQFPSL